MNVFILQIYLSLKINFNVSIVLLRIKYVTLRNRFNDFKNLKRLKFFGESRNAIRSKIQAFINI